MTDAVTETNITPERSAANPPSCTAECCKSDSKQKKWRNWLISKFQCILGLIEFLGFALIALLASLGILKEVCYQIYHNNLISLTFIEDKTNSDLQNNSIGDIFSILLSFIEGKTHSDLRNNYIGDLFFILILVEIVSLIKTTAQSERLTPAYPIAIGITSLIREIIKPTPPPGPYSIIVASVGVIALSGAIWILGKSRLDTETKAE